MSVDLSSNTSFARISLIVMDDCLIKLEHGRTQDRIRKFRFDAIESVIIWRKTPWIRILICLFVFVLPGIGILFIQQVVATVTGLFLLALGVGLIGWYLYCKSTVIRIARRGNSHDLTGLFRRGKLQRFRERLISGIVTHQRKAIVSPRATSMQDNEVMEGSLQDGRSHTDPPTLSTQSLSADLQEEPPPA